MFFITFRSFSGVFVVGAGESLDEAWQNLEEAVDAVGESLPVPNSEDLTFFKGEPLNVTAKVTFEID
jgi:predicted RNase H-like HicB family nuclease